MSDCNEKCNELGNPDSGDTKCCEYNFVDKNCYVCSGSDVAYGDDGNPHMVASLPPDTEAIIPADY